MTVITQPNAGKSMASKHAIMATAGEIIVTLDRDTLFGPRNISMLARHLYDSPAPDRWAAGPGTRRSATAPGS